MKKKNDRVRMKRDIPLGPIDEGEDYLKNIVSSNERMKKYGKG